MKDFGTWREEAFHIGLSEPVTREQIDAWREERGHTMTELAARMAELAARDQDRRSRMAALSEAFAPGTIPGLAAELWRLKEEIYKLEREHAALEKILTEHMKTTGEVIEVEGQPALRLVSFYRFSSGRGVEEHRARFDRKGSTQ